MKQNQVKAQYMHRNFYKIKDSLLNVFIKILAYGSAIFALTLVLLFYYLNIFQFHYFIDEKFHIPQALRFCKGQFLEWDPKITTLPGLYLFSALILGPINLCTIKNLRFLNVFFTYFNLFLSSLIIKFLNIKSENKFKNNLRSYKLYLTAWNITFFPPLFFWFFLYYTDIFSVVLILLMFLLHLYNNNKTAALVGLFSIFARQTNVIWVAFLCIDRGLSLIDEITKKPYLTNTINIIPCIKILHRTFRAEMSRGILPFFKFIKTICKPIFPYTLVLAFFAVFVIYNRGIVVGDRSAHIPTTHLAQIFYFSLFIFCFSWPYLLPYFTEFLQDVRKHLVLVSLSLCFCIIIVHYNTLVHPYILSDNRHYSFYVWKNLMNRYVLFKYILIPVYAFAIYAALKSLSHLKLLFVAAYILCTCIVLIPQLLLEPRYFIIPYIFFRLHQEEPKNWQIVAETLTTTFIIIVQFVLFINKTFYWNDEKYPQRIGW